MGRFLVLTLALSAVAAERDRAVESVLPSLDSGPGCWSSIELQNLGDRTVTVDLEAHRASGALVALAGHPQAAAYLAPGERAAYRLEVPDESGAAWVKIRERIPAPQLSPVIAIAGYTECVSQNQLRTTTREVTFPMRDPWFSGDVEELRGGIISVVNTSERPARIALCYSSGNLYSMPRAGAAPVLSPICSSSADVQIPPFGGRQFPLERDGTTHFALKSQGEAIVLQMLRPLETGIKFYKVDSTIKFGGEVPSR